MANLNKILTLVTLSVVSTLILFGCSSEEPEKKPAQKVQAPRPKPKPKAKSVDKLVSDLSIDQRIYLHESDAPRKEAPRVAVLKFAHALLNVDEASLKGMIPFEDQLELDVMIDAGLSAYMNDVSLVELKTGFSPDGRECLAIIFEIGLEYQVQIWYFQKTQDGYNFSSAETSPYLVDQLSGDWVVDYFKLKEDLIEIANQPDDETSYALAGELTATDGNLGNDGPPRPTGPDGPGGPISPGGPKGPGR